MTYNVYHSDRWLDIPFDEWMRVAVMKSGLGESGEHFAQTLKQHMRSLIPVKGGDIIRDLQVIVQRGDMLKKHRHPQWACIYYVSSGDPPVHIVIEDERVAPEAGMFVVMAPGTEHSIEASQSDTIRLGFAMLVENWE